MRVNLQGGLTTSVRGLIRYDYGQSLEIYNTGLQINNIEFQFIQNGEQIDQLGQYNSEFDCYTVSVPDKFLKNSDEIRCYIYVEDEKAGKTKKVIVFNVYDREMFDAVEDEKTESLLAEIMAKLNKLQEQLDNFQLTETQLQSIMTQVIAALSDKYYTSEQIDEKFSNLQKGIGQSFSSMSNTINQQNNKFSEVASQLIQMNDKIETLKTEVETANAVLETI